MASEFHIEVATEGEIPTTASLMIKTFSHYEFERMVGNIDTPEGIEAALPRFHRSWREHMDETGRPSVIKCIHTDPKTGQETMAACAQWFIFPTRRSAENEQTWNHHQSTDHLPEANGVREKALRTYTQVGQTRIKWTAGRGAAFLQYMATHRDWRRRGAATMCVQWGLEICKELGILAYLEASEEGRPLYEKLGFERVDEVDDGMGAVYPIMIWWPPGIPESDKTPLKP